MGILSTIIILFNSLNAFALTPENIFQNDVEIIELLGSKARVPKTIEGIPFGIKEYDDYLKDPQNRVNDLFKVDPYFLKDVKFWFYIYTVFSSYHIVLHDKENLALIYDVVEFDELQKSNLSSYTKYALQLRLTKERVKLVKRDFLFLQKNHPKTTTQKKIVASLRKIGFKIPKFSRKRRTMFKGLAKNLRTQTGQKDSIQNGINNYAIYKPTFDKWLKYFDLPKELLWISFLESSFNTKAKSKVGATGVWQFMRRIGRYFMPYNKIKDGRLNPLMSTLSAFHLLHQNKKILGRWDLAIPAYNSGTKHLIKARRKLKIRNPSLKKILSSYNHPHLGFASKHFYSEFLALSHAQAYREKFYDLSKLKKSAKIINVYISKCKISRKWFTSRLKKNIPRIKEFNSHLKARKYLYPPGTILFSPSELTKKRYLKLSLKQLRKKYPKNYLKYLKGYSCSTK